MRILFSCLEKLLVTSGLLAIFLLTAHPVLGQSLGNAGTIQGTVLDPTGAAVGNADVSILNRISGYTQSTKTDTTGAFRLSNIPPNPYHFEVKASGFGLYSQDVSVRGSIPVTLTANLAVAGSSTTVTVEAAGADLLELDPSAHVDVDHRPVPAMW